MDNLVVGSLLTLIPRFVGDTIGYAQLADVVKQTRAFQPNELAFVQPEAAADRQRVVGDALRVMIGRKASATSGSNQLPRRLRTTTDARGCPSSLAKISATCATPTMRASSGIAWRLRPFSVQLQLARDAHPDQTGSRCVALRMAFR